MRSGIHEENEFGIVPVQSISVVGHVIEKDKKKVFFGSHYRNEVAP